MRLLRPPALCRGDTLGVFTPSLPANVLFQAKYEHGLQVLRRLGFRVIEGELTRRCVSDGYRSGTPQQRAQEFMALVLDPEVKGLIATMGDCNSSSMIPFLDFGAIRAHPKVICGYSDVTSLHLAILARAGVRTFYGPAVVTSFAEWPDVLPETRDSFMQAVSAHRSGQRELTPPTRWSNHFGAFHQVVGFIVGKPEHFDAQAAAFSYDELIVETVGAGRSFPIVTSFDCGHTHPMLTIAEMTPIHLTAGEGFDVRLNVEEPMVDATREEPAATPSGARPSR